MQGELLSGRGSGKMGSSLVPSRPGQGRLSGEARERLSVRERRCSTALQSRPLDLLQLLTRLQSPSPVSHSLPTQPSYVLQ